MRNQFIAILTVATTVLSAGAAFAGTSVTNEYEHKNIYNGTSTTIINVDAYKEYTQYNTSDSIKVETYGGDTNISTATYKNGQLSGSAISTNNVAVDPVAIITVASQKETVFGFENVDVHTVETYNFSGNTFKHTVSSDAF